MANKNFNKDTLSKEIVVKNSEDTNIINKTGYVNTVLLNVRSNASASSKILDVINLEDKVNIVGSKDDFYKITYSTKIGYVMKQFITIEEK